MALTLADVLALDAVREAEPSLVVAGAGTGIPIRWVHSSEIYEIGPLLAGGELLLTTGLGLAGVDAGARRHWVRELAGRGVAGVALELGRSITEPPAELVDEATRAGLPLVLLHRVVPFIRICQEANGAILHADRARLRLVDDTVRLLHAVVARGGGLAGVAQGTAEATGTPAVLVTRSGRVVAAAGVDDDRAAQRLGGPDVAVCPITLGGIEWGTALIGRATPGSVPKDTADALVGHVADLAAVVVAQTGGAHAGTEDAAASLLADLVDDAVPGERELLVRAGLAGFHPAPGSRVLAVASSAPDPRGVLARLRTATHAVGADLLAGRVRGQVLALVAIGPSPERPEPTRWLVGALEGGDAIVVVGQAVALEGAGRSLREAHADLPLATLLGAGAVPARQLVLPGMLSGLSEQRLRHLVDDALAALLSWDAAHGSDLVHTLGVHLRHGCRPGRSAAALHVHRQSLHQRLARITELLGHPVDDPGCYEHLLVATAASRLLAARTHPPVGA